MPTLIPKKNMPVVQYNPVMIDNEIVMFAPSESGIIAFYPAVDQIRHISYMEILEWAMKEPIEKKKKTRSDEDEGDTREITNPD